MTETKAAHTPGAIRAAEAITGWGVSTPYAFQVSGVVGSRTTAGIASLIDRETAASETAAQRDRLLEACKEAKDDIGRFLEGKWDAHRTWHSSSASLGAAIAAAEPKGTL